MLIMSANLCSWGDGEISKPARQPRVKAVFETYAPDLIGVQESTADWSQFLKGTFTDYGCTGIGREPGIHDEACHIFYKKDRFGLVSEETFWLSDTPDTVSMGWDAACTRVCTYLVLFDKQTGKQFAYFNTHLDHVGPIAQEKGAQLVADRMQKTDLPILLSGDFNVTEDSAAYKTFAALLTDTRTACKKQHTGGTFHAYGEIADMAAEKPIDHIFASPASTFKNYAILTDKIDGKFVSDHYFVLADLEL